MKLKLFCVTSKVSNVKQNDCSSFISLKSKMIIKGLI